MNISKKDTQGFDLRGFSAAVIGCGGLGCNVCIHLAGAGIGKLVLYDFDTVSPSNLNRQFLYTPADEGKSKVLTAAERLAAYAPDIGIQAVEKRITSVDDLSFVKECDILIIAADNNETRAVCEAFCDEHKITLINGGINGFYGTCYMKRPGDPCFSCAGITAAKEKKITSVSAAAGVIGALCAETAIKYLTKCEPVTGGRLLIYDGGEINGMDIIPAKSCKCRNCLF